VLFRDRALVPSVSDWDFWVFRARVVGEAFDESTFEEVAPAPEPLSSADFVRFDLIISKFISSADLRSVLKGSSAFRLPSSITLREGSP
jgi:hypothetical protein